MKIALIADELTTACLKERWHVMELTPWNYRWILRYGKPDLLLVESAWKGLRNRWKYKIANYPDHPKRSNATLKKSGRTSARSRHSDCILEQRGWRTF